MTIEARLGRGRVGISHVTVAKPPISNRNPFRAITQAPLPAVVDVRMLSTMPSYILTCESCGSHQPFVVYEQGLGELQNGKTIIRPCPLCRAATNFKSGSLRDVVAEIGVRAEIGDLPKIQPFLQESGFGQRRMWIADARRCDEEAFVQEV